MAKMPNRKIRKQEGEVMLYFSPILLCAGDLVGWFLTQKLAGSQAAMEFFWVSVFSTTSVLVLQFWLYAQSRNRLLYQILFLGAGGLALVWYMLCLILPIFWISEIGADVKISLVSGACFLFLCNGIKGFLCFRKKLGETDVMIMGNYDQRGKSLEWDKVLWSLKLSLSLYVPGIPNSVIPFITALMVVSMLVGLSLRKLFPVFSVFAWGIPCIFLSSYLVQIMAGRVAQALKVVELEIEIGANIECRT